MMETQVQANVVFTDDAYLKTRYFPRADGGYTIRVGRGGRRDILSCKELYGKAVKTALELECTACAFDPGPMAELGQNGLFAALEGVYGGAYQKKFALSGRWEPELACSFPGADETQLNKARELARSILQTRNLVNRPSNLLRPEALAQQLQEMAAGLPVEAEIYDRSALEQLGLRALLTVGDSSAHAPRMAVLRYTGAPENSRRLGLVGKGRDGRLRRLQPETGRVHGRDQGRYGGRRRGRRRGARAGGERCGRQRDGGRPDLRKPHFRREHAARRRHHQLLRPDDRDPERRCRGAADPGRCPRVGRGEGGLHASGGHRNADRRDLVDARLCDDRRDGQRRRLLRLPYARGCALRRKKFWRMPDDAEYEKLIESDYADVRNTSKDGCGAITAGLFLKKFTAKRPWLHLDIAGTADNTGIVWQHQVPGATGTAVSTLYHLSQVLFETKEEPACIHP